MTVDQALALLASPIGRVTLAAWAVNAIVRLLKEDTRLLPTIPAGQRRLLAGVLGLAAGAIEAVVAGASWQTAFVAIGSPVLAIVVHHVVVDGLRGGRDLSIPSWLLARKPPSDPPPSRKHISGIGGAAFLLLVGCGGSERQACYAAAEAQALAAAAERCPGAWEDCPERPAVLAELQARQEACP